MKKLLKFETLENYNAVAENLVFPTVSKVVENQTVWFKTKPRFDVDIEQSAASDICFYSKNDDKLIVVPYSNWTVERFPVEEYTPVGVVVIPGSHNVYGTGECGVMSVVPMNYSTPDTGGTSERSIYWGGYGTDISTLTNYDVVNLTSNDSTNTVSGTNSSGYLPSDNITSTQCAHDTNSYYNQTSQLIPSPYLTDGSRNPSYYSTDLSTANALSDFDGTGNTNKLIGLSTSQSDWKTASTITNSSDAGYYPAACCCWRYCPTGTKQGDWYLPACGELGYIMPKFKKINETITTLKNVYNVGVQLDSSDFYWTSSEFSSSDARYVSTDYGLVSYDLKSYDYYVRAFVRVGA